MKKAFTILMVTFIFLSNIAYVSGEISDEDWDSMGYKDQLENIQTGKASLEQTDTFFEKNGIGSNTADFNKFWNKKSPNNPFEIDGSNCANCQYSDGVLTIGPESGIKIKTPDGKEFKSSSGLIICKSDSCYFYKAEGEGIIDLYGKTTKGNELDVYSGKIGNNQVNQVKVERSGDSFRGSGTKGSSIKIPRVPTFTLGDKADWRLDYRKNQVFFENEGPPVRISFPDDRRFGLVGYENSIMQAGIDEDYVEIQGGLVFNENSFFKNNDELSSSIETEGSFIATTTETFLNNFANRLPKPKQGETKELSDKQVRAAVLNAIFPTIKPKTDEFGKLLAGSLIKASGLGTSASLEVSGDGKFTLGQGIGENDRGENDRVQFSIIPNKKGGFKEFRPPAVATSFTGKKENNERLFSYKGYSGFDFDTKQLKLSTIGRFKEGDLEFDGVIKYNYNFDPDKPYNIYATISASNPGSQIRVDAKIGEDLPIITFSGHTEFQNVKLFGQTAFEEGTVSDIKVGGRIKGTNQELLAEISANRLRDYLKGRIQYGLDNNKQVDLSLLYNLPEEKMEDIGVGYTQIINDRIFLNIKGGLIDDSPGGSVKIGFYW